jgi:hypothetical protein
VGTNISFGGGGALITMSAAKQQMKADKSCAGETVAVMSRQFELSGGLVFDMGPYPCPQGRRRRASARAVGCRRRRRRNRHKSGLLDPDLLKWQLIRQRWRP